MAYKEPKKSTTFLNIPIRRELRNRLKAKAALKGKNLYDFCAEVLEASLNDEGENK